MSIDGAAISVGCVPLHSSTVKSDCGVDALLPVVVGPDVPYRYLWAWLKRQALANFYPKSLADLKMTARSKLRSGQRRQSIVTAYWKQAEPR